MAVALQLVGALLILAPFAGQQLGSLRPDSPTYLWLNLLGSGLLAALALIGGQWGFLLLEGCWAMLSLRSLIGGNRSAGAGLGG